MTTTHPTTVGIDYEPARVSKAGRLVLVAVLSTLLVAGLLATVATVPTLALPLLLAAAAGLLAAVVVGLVVGATAGGAAPRTR